MATLIDRHQPSFVLWPLQNARTAYAPVYLPMIFVVPHRRYKDGTPVPSSEVSNVTFRIEKAPGRAKVAGFQYRGILVPQLERFRITLNALDLSKHKITVLSQVFEDEDGETIDSNDAVEGDYFRYTTEQGTLTDRIKYLPDADYYDLSPISLETGQGLKPLGKYVFSWCADYFRRVVTPNDELYCIDTSIARLARLGVVFDHPGDVHQEMFEKTPSFVFNATTDSLDKDPTFKFYRPFADVLNDLFDESSFLETINHVDHIQASLIPYLSYLLGWEMRFVPGSTDDTRRRVLKNARRLQQLKGSKRAIRELFDIFQYTIEIINLWYKPDGSGFIGPDENLPTAPELEITAESVCRAEPLLVDYATDGWGEIDIPLLYRPEGNVTIEAWLVKTSSALYPVLLELGDSFETLEGGSCATDMEGYQISSMLHGALPAGSVVGYSKVLMNQTVNGSTQASRTGHGPLSQSSIKYDSYFNRLTVTFDRYLQFADDEKLFVFATYEREKLNIPDALADLRANRFDIRILERAQGNEVDPQVLEFLIDLIHRLKAFHSLLRKIIFTINLADVYAVTDFCVGGDNIQRPGTTAGEQQVSPAIIPTDVTVAECSDDSMNRGFKDSDYSYRDAVLAGLEEEFLAWKALDGKYDVQNRALFESLSRTLIPETTQPTGEDCQWTDRGQDRKYTADIDLDHDVDIRAKACDVSTSTDDYCYNGRVTGELEQSYAIPLDEVYRYSPCNLMQGVGFYYLLPYVSESWCPNSTGCIAPDEIAALHRSHLEQLLARVIAFRGASLKYTDKNYLTPDAIDNRSQWAIMRPSLQIQKDNMFIPGHRQMTGNKLAEDFTHPAWTLRPWDDALTPKCPGGAVLEAELVENTDGDEELIFDETVPLVYYGNSLSPDVPGFGEHSGTDQPLVTHKIFTSAPRSEYVDLEGVVYTEDLVGTGETPPETVCLTDEIGKIFPSAADSTGVIAASSLDFGDDFEDEDFF